MEGVTSKRAPMSEGERFKGNKGKCPLGIQMTAETAPMSEGECFEKGKKGVGS